MELVLVAFTGWRRGKGPPYRLRGLRTAVDLYHILSSKYYSDEQGPASSVATEQRQHESAMSAAPQRTTMALQRQISEGVPESDQWDNTRPQTMIIQLDKRIRAKYELADRA